MLKATTLLLFICITLISGQTDSAGSTQWNLTVQGGFPINAPLPLRIRLDTEIIDVIGKFHSEPFNLPVYWDIRVERWVNNNSFELELIHHKLYLQDLPREIQEFSISHGYNILLFNRGYRKETPFIWRFGGGVVIPHPENQIYEKKLPAGGFGGSGYYIGGPAVQIAGSTIYSPFHWFQLSLELKCISALCWVPVYDGYAFVPNISLHLNGGFGFRVGYNGD